jgi:hypothetical protein
LKYSDHQIGKSIFDCDRKKLRKYLAKYFLWVFPCAESSREGFSFEKLMHRLRFLGGFAAFEPFGLWPAMRAAMRKNTKRELLFFLIAKAANRAFLNLKTF